MRRGGSGSGKRELVDLTGDEEGDDRGRKDRMRIVDIVDDDDECEDVVYEGQRRRESTLSVVTPVPPSGSVTLGSLARGNSNSNNNSSRPCKYGARCNRKERCAFQHPPHPTEATGPPQRNHGVDYNYMRGVFGSEQRLQHFLAEQG